MAACGVVTIGRTLEQQVEIEKNPGLSSNMLALVAQSVG